MNRHVILAVVAGLACAVNTARAASIGVHFHGDSESFATIPTGDSTLLPGDQAGVVPQKNWNMSPSVPNQGYASALTDDSGQVTPVTLWYQGNDAWHSDGPSDTPDDRLMRGTLKTSAPGYDDPAFSILAGTMHLTWQNLPAGNYDVYLYIAENSAGAEGNFTVGSKTFYVTEISSFDGTFVAATSTDPNNRDQTANYCVWKDVPADANGNILIVGFKNDRTNDGLGVTAVQIVKKSGTFPVNTAPAAATSGPDDTVAVEGGTATFNLVLNGPWAVQWRKNGQPIAGATNVNGTTSTYTTPTLTVADSGSKYDAVLSNNVGNTTTKSATVTVDAKTPPTLSQGFLIAERWENIGGNTGTGGIGDLITAIAGGPPTTTFYVSEAAVPQTSPNIDNFGQRLSGWLKPTVTGDYDFFTASDDPSQVFLNATAASSGTNSLPDVNTSTPIAEEDACCNPFAEPSAGTTRTTAAPIHLEAGKLYGIVILHKEGGGGDYVRVAWRLTTDTTAAASLTPISGVYLWTMAVHAGARVAITQQPQSATITEGRLAILKVNASTLPTANQFGVQWAKNGVDIPGANSTTYNTPILTVADSGAKYVAKIIALAGATNSAEALITVVPDTFPPVAAVGAINHDGVIQVGVSFDKPVTLASVGAQANYTLQGGTITGLTVITNDTGAVLSTTGLTVGNSYTLTIKNIVDTHTPPNTLTSTNVTFKVPATQWASIGKPTIPAAVVPVGDNGYDVISGGSGFWASYDEVTFVYVPKTNDFDVITQIIEQDPSSEWARGGLQAREVTDEGKSNDDVTAGYNFSAYREIHANANTTDANQNLTSNNSFEANMRVGLKYNDGADNVTSGWGTGANLAAPTYPDVWLRIARIGNHFRGARSVDGVNWLIIADNDWTNCPPVLLVGPGYSPENANAWNDVSLYKSYKIQYRNFGDFARPATGGSAGQFTGITKTGSNITITWTGAGVLQSASDVSGPWTNVPNASSPAAITPSSNRAFYRLKL
jgi:PA14 domain